MTGRNRAVAVILCGGRIVPVHDGGCAQVYNPFRGLLFVKRFRTRRSRPRTPSPSLRVPASRGAGMAAWPKM